jgi:hypothetical protein
MIKMYQDIPHHDIPILMKGVQVKVVSDEKWLEMGKPCEIGR